MIWNDEKLIKVLKEGGVVVMPTDTLYGIVGCARNPAVVERIYKIRKRALEKPCVVLIGDINELEKFSIILSEEQKTAIKKHWPSSVSTILECPDESLAYLHRGTKTLAFRIPASQSLRGLLIKVGPLIAPSANPEGLSPAHTVVEAKKYFGTLVDLYIDGGTISGKASKVVRLHKDGSISIIRE